MERQLSILGPVGYPWRFNSPKRSRHDISVRSFVPFNYISLRIEGVTIFNPLPPKRFDLVHAFNRIPLGTRPFVIGFERHLPRGLGVDGTAFYRWMRAELASDRCRAIIAISEYARRMFLAVHRAAPECDALRRKLHVRLPNIEIDAAPDAFDCSLGRPIHIVFVGNHFARKGGCVTLRIAELAAQRKLPLVAHIVSKLQVGPMSWVDPQTDDFFEPYRKLLSLPNVVYHRSLPNAAVLALVRKSHFAILATFSDTFGYSAIESMANYTPVIATPIGALPEFIKDRHNGIMLHLETNEMCEWIRHDVDRTTQKYGRLFQDQIEHWAHTTLDRVVQLTADAKYYAALRANARATAVSLFSATDANTFWDELYERAVEGVVTVAFDSD